LTGVVGGRGRPVPSAGLLPRAEGQRPPVGHRTTRDLDQPDGRSPAPACSFRPVWHRLNAAVPVGGAAHGGAPAKARHGSGAACGAAPVADRRLDPAALHPDGHLDRLRVVGPIQDGVGGGLADGQDQVVDNLARDGSWQFLQAASDGTPQPGKAGGRRGGKGDFQLLPAAGVAAVMPWWGVLQARVVQVRHREVVAAAWRQPSRSPRQSPPAVTVRARSFSDGAALARPSDPPQPIQLRRHRPAAVLQVLQVAVAVERPAVDAARPAPPVAGLRGARTGVVRLRPAAAVAAFVEPGSGRDADLPGPARLSAAHEPSPPLAVPGSDQPTKQTGTATPEPHGTRPPYSPAVGSAGTVWVPPATRRRTGRRVLDHGSLPGHQVGVGPPLRVRASARSGRLTWRSRLSSIKPRRGGGKPQRNRPGAARATPPAVYRRGRAGLGPDRGSPWLGAAGRKPSLGLAGRSQ
jgi:hypothetical protein